MKLLACIRIILLMALALCFPCATRLNDSPIPEPTYKKTGCRLLLNEINLFTDDTHVKQFVELGRYCPNMQSYQKTIAMEGVKLIFLDYEGYLVTVCEMNKHLVPKVVTIQRDKSKGIPKQVRKHWLYLVGKGYSDIDFLLDDCQIVPPFRGSPKRFWIGVDYPTGIAVVYNKVLSKLNQINLENKNGNYVRKKITPPLLEQITSIGCARNMS